MSAEPDLRKKELEEQLKNDNRDVADLWKEALKSYKGVVGFDLQRKFDNVQGMLDFGTDQMNNFHKFRHDKGKVDRLRTLFASNLDLVEQGANQIISAASPAFPPAAAIGTALTYLLQACRSVSADYDIVIVFFDDMNSFLTRITILETRLPKYKAYQNCLMEVFTSILTMCGFAHKYIELGRFKKWISNLFKGDDGELGGARSNMNKRLEHLQQATEFAILGNTEETLKMTAQLEENQRSHSEMLEEVGHAINTIHENTASIKDDVAKLLKLFGGQKKEKQPEKPQANKPPSANGIRNAMPVVGQDDHEYQVLKETLLTDSCSWVFSEPEWEEWLNMKDGTRPILAITGQPGTGKSHLAASVHDMLEQRAREDDTGHTCVAHFYFREQEESFAWFICGMITLVNQIAETNNAACEKLNAQIARDDIDLDTTLWRDISKYLLGAVFEQDSKFHLFIVFDGLDELSDWDSFKEFLSKFIVDERLRISLAVTSRPERLNDLPEDTKMIRIEATKEKQRQDLKSLIWHQINSLNHLRRFSRYVQQRVAVKVEEASPNMLYAEHLLVRLNNLGREGAVLRALEQKKPEDLHDIYETLLAECQRRMPVIHQQVAASLLHWIAFAKRGLTLTEVQSLVKCLSQDDEFDIEEIPEFFSKFLRIGDPGYDAELRAKHQASTATAQDLRKDDDNDDDDIYEDGPLPVKFQERSMRNYFTNSSHGSSLFRWGPSEAHRRIFLTSTKLAQPSRTDASEDLQKYCALYLFAHWYDIQIDQHTPEEQVEVLEAFAEALSNKTGLSEMLGRAGMVYEKGSTTNTDSRIRYWAKLLEKPEIKAALSEFAVEWWQRVGQDPPTSRLGLAKGYLRELYQAQSSHDAIQAWERLSGVLNVTGLGKLLMEQAYINFPDQFKDSKDHDDDNNKEKAKEEDGFDETVATLGILNLFGDEIKPDAGAHRAVSQVLFEKDYLRPAEKICRTALELCNPRDHEWYRASCVLSYILLYQKKKKEAYDVIDTAVAELRANEVPPHLKRIVHTACAKAQKKMGYLGPALKSYADAKSADPDGITPAEDLVGELKVLDRKRDKTEYIQVLKSWSLLERITWLASNYEDEGEERHSIFCDIACETGEQEFMVKFYEEVTGFLDNLDAGTPLRLDLALVYFEVCRDPKKALKTLDEVFDSHATGFLFPITAVTATWMIQRAVDTMVNVQVELFRKSRDPIYKAERLNSLAGLMQRPFSLDVPRISAFYTSRQRVGLAYMYMVMGPVAKFQEVLQSLLDDSFAGLSDSVGWNDGLYLWMLAQALAILSRALGNDEKLRRYARIVGSGLFSRLSKGDNDEEKEVREQAIDGDSRKKQVDSEGKQEAVDDGGADMDSDDSDDSEMGDPPEDEGDLLGSDEAWYGCGGFCNPSRTFRWWGGRSAYFYVTFATGIICEECQAEYETIQRGEGTFKGRYFYGIGHDHLKLPVEGWRGVRDGVLTLEGEEPITVTDFIKKLQTEVCEDAWGRLWEGGLK
ncbi:uncharacterized protein NECHADRAFT_84310 [Fusarium vanettenii 77-13-4]|uniref:Fungal STAND N-terminal Goodbye domain-containing protein n=1 Tax=Fusarium vanettenii (strain ATCC MYA-4622 / CBS 123669 / FGSC 9596 / NRRL 45880 / 77-13-4) TaxID=660122 RepID=C7ZCR2_FUSV7|nr:uncharacterized protein NECHADRAFT_84310 [Fusarium vanettenii 77-13-4]EEU37966.1 predicted protein [Fusarium vanettenii 77-13-4]